MSHRHNKSCCCNSCCRPVSNCGNNCGNSCGGGFGGGLGSGCGGGGTGIWLILLLLGVGGGNCGRRGGFGLF
jgi:hypothetical protein